MMMRPSFVFLTVCAVAAVFCAVQALECGIDSGSKSNDLRQIAENCMKKKSEDKPKVTSDPEDDEEDETKKGNTESSNSKKRSKRSEDKSSKKDNDESKNGDKDNNRNNGDKDNNRNNSTAGEKDNCVVHCIFGQLGMVDGEGFPVHHRVLNALLNNAHGRELRDFVQDTTDECFQLMEQGDHQDPCQFSVTLVNCLSERGKSNCADWPIGNLPFLNKKN